LPVVEFRKQLHGWREQGLIVPMTVERNGVVKQFDDIANHPDWRVEARDWEMRLLDFRVIQAADKPNQCRW
jgi:hypothetical protein